MKTHRNREFILFIYHSVSLFLSHFPSACSSVLPSTFCIVHLINLLFLARFLGHSSCLLMIDLFAFCSALHLHCLLLSHFFACFSVYSLSLVLYSPSPLFPPGRACSSRCCTASSFCPVAVLVLPKNSRTFCAPRSM